MRNPGAGLRGAVGIAKSVVGTDAISDHSAPVQARDAVIRVIEAAAVAAVHNNPSNTLRLVLLAEELRRGQQ
ncbi:MAG TPA: hypothetical protein VD932_01065 [Aquabacterium sp.]|nr:hypothetical protein [Aquabacterium sp.]